MQRFHWITLVELVNVELNEIKCQKKKKKKMHASWTYDDHPLNLQIH